MINADVEDVIFERVADELARNDLQPGLMAKALAKGNGDHDRSLYIQFRAEQLAGEIKRDPHSPDTVLHAFTVRGPGGLFGTKCRLVVRQNTLSFCDPNTGEELVIDPRRGDYGIELRSPLISPNNITLINPRGEKLVFRASANPVRVLKSWWKEQKNKMIPLKALFERMLSKRAVLFDKLRRRCRLV